jgi:ubiquinone/menaquinone biosynthesis C-methylase UbiE
MPQKEALRQKTIAYHSMELRNMLDPQSRQSLPEFRVGEMVLDIGCGAGQTLIARADTRSCVGLDKDMDALELGKRWRPELKLVHAAAESLPFAPGSFDLVMARVSLPYTNIPVVLLEISRVLKPGGRFWTMLHSYSKMRQIYLRDLNWKRWGAFGLVTINGLFLHFLHRPLRLPASKLETFQTQSGFRHLLAKAGFENITFEQGITTVASARKPVLGDRSCR